VANDGDLALNAADPQAVRRLAVPRKNDNNDMGRGPSHQSRAHSAIAHCGSNWPMARLSAFVLVISEFAQPITDTASGFSRVLIGNGH